MNTDLTSNSQPTLDSLLSSGIYSWCCKDHNLHLHYHVDKREETPRHSAFQYCGGRVALTLHYLLCNPKYSLGMLCFLLRCKPHHPPHFLLCLLQYSCYAQSSQCCWPNGQSEQTLQIVQLRRMLASTTMRLCLVQGIGFCLLHFAEYPTVASSYDKSIYTPISQRGGWTPK